MQTSCHISFNTEYIFVHIIGSVPSPSRVAAGQSGCNTHVQGLAGLLTGTLQLQRGGRKRDSPYTCHLNSLLLSPSNFHFHRAFQIHSLKCNIIWSAQYEVSRFFIRCFTNEENLFAYYKHLFSALYLEHSLTNYNLRKEVGIFYIFSYKLRPFRRVPMSQIVQTSHS